VVAVRPVGPALVLLASAPGVAAAAEEPTPVVAEVTDLRGRVEWRTDGAEAWEPVALEQGLRLRDALRTGGRSTVELRFVDGTLLALGEHTRLRITLALFDVERSPPEVRVALAAGRLDVRTATSPLTVESEDETVRVEPGDAARLELAGGKLVVVPLPEARVFSVELSHPDMGPWGAGALVVPRPRLVGAARAQPGAPTSALPWALGPVETAAGGPRPGPDPGPEVGPGPGPDPDPDPDPGPEPTGVRVRVRPRGEGS